MKYLSKFITPFLVFSLVLSSCSVSDKQSTIPTEEKFPVQNSKSFKIKSLETKANEEFRIKVIKKSEDLPIEITNEYQNPFVSDIDFQGFSFKPIYRKKYTHKALTKQEIRAKRKEARKKWNAWHNQRSKEERKNLREQQKTDKILEIEQFKEIISLYDKGTLDYCNFIEEEIQKREKELAENKEERKDLREKYKEEIISFKSLLDEVYPKNGQKPVFDSDGEIEDCDPNNPICDVFPSSVSGNFPSDTEEYDYYDLNDTENSYEIDNTYLNGQPYSDSYLMGSGENYKPAIDQNGFKIEGNKFSLKANSSSQCTLPVQLTSVVNGDYTRLQTIIKDAKSCTNLSRMEIEITPTKYSDKCNQKNTIKLSASGPLSVAFDVSNKILPLEYQTKITIYDYVTNKTSVSSFVTKRALTPSSLSVDLASNSQASTLISQYDPSRYIAYHINNNSGSYADLKLLNSKNEIKYQGTCLSTATGDLLFDKDKLETDKYSLVVSLSDNPTYEKRLSFIVTKPKISTFVTSTTPNNSLLTDFQYTAYQNSSNSSDIIYKRILPQTSYQVTVPGSIDVPSIPSNDSCSSSTQGKNLVKDIITKTSFNGNSEPNESKELKLFMLDLLKSEDGSSIKSYNKFESVSIENCTSKSISIGSIVDLTNSDFNINKTLQTNGSLIELKFYLEDFGGRTIAEFPFVAITGAKNIIWKKIPLIDQNGKKLNGNFRVRVGVDLNSNFYNTFLSQSFLFFTWYTGQKSLNYDRLPYLAPYNISNPTQLYLSKCSTELDETDRSRIVNMFESSSTQEEKSINTIISENNQYINANSVLDYGVDTSLIEKEYDNYLGFNTKANLPQKTESLTNFKNRLKIILAKAETAKNTFLKQVKDPGVSIALLRISAKEAQIAAMQILQEINTTQVLVGNGQVQLASRVPELARLGISAAAIVEGIVISSMVVVKVGNTTDNLNYIDSEIKLLLTQSLIQLNKIQTSTCQAYARPGYLLVISNKIIQILTPLIETSNNSISLILDSYFTIDKANLLKGQIEVTRETLNKLGQRITDECSEKGPDCKPDDYLLKSGITLTANTIKCRVCNTITNPIDRTDIEKNLDLINSARESIKSFKVRDVNFKTVGFAKVTTTLNGSPFNGTFFAVSGRTDQTDDTIGLNNNVIGKTINGNVFITLPYSNINDRKFKNLLLTHSETKLIEFIYKKYYLDIPQNKRDIVNVTMFTDRDTCSTCSTVPQEAYRLSNGKINVNRVYGSKIYKMGTQEITENGIEYLSGEGIPLLPITGLIKYTGIVCTK